MEQIFAGCHDYTGIDIHHAGHEACSPSHRHGGIRPNYVVHYVHGGKGRYRIQNRSYSIGAGTAFVIFPGLEHTYIADAHDPWSYSWIGFSGPSAKEFMTRLSSAPSNPLLTVRSRSVCSRSFANLISCYKKKASGYDIRALGYFYLIFYELSAGIPRNLTSQDAKKTEWIQRVIQFIDANYHSDIKVNDISTYLSMDRSYISSEFTKHTGITLHEYLLQLRIARAEQLLRETKMSYRNIAYSVGYHDYAVFARSFKKKKKVSMSEWRKKFNV